MARKLAVLLSFALLCSIPAGPSARAAAGAPIDNGEQRVTGHAFRSGAPQTQPDISSDFIVWVDGRGDTHEYPQGPFGPRLQLWAKDLSTRDELRVSTELGTDDARPRISGNWVVWTDHTPDPDGGGPLTSNDDIYARQLPDGPVIQVTNDSAPQMNPAIDGTTVVWEDYRNQGISNQGVDLYTRELPRRSGQSLGPEQALVTANGNQVSPAVSGGDIAWRDGRDSGVILEADVWVKLGRNDPVKIADAEGNARSLSEFQVAMGEGRVLWNEKDPTCGVEGCHLPRVVKTCALSRIGCGAATTVDTVPGSGGFGMISDLDASGSGGVWAVQSGSDSHAYTDSDLSNAGPLVPVDDLEGPGSVAGSRIDGGSYAWVQQPGDSQLSDTDVYWRNETTQPRRANSLGLGPFGTHLNPAADGDTVVYRRTPVEQTGTNDLADTGFQLWATDLSGARSPRHYPVTSLLGTDASRPAVAGDRVVWSECRFNFSQSDCGVIFQADALNPSDESLEDLSKLGPPDADGQSTAWRCGELALCAHDGSELHFFDVSALIEDPGAPEHSIVSRVVRMSGSFIVWHEFYCLPGEEGCAASASRLHVLDVGTGDNNVIADGVVDEFPDFDISGTTVIWTRTVDETTRVLMLASADCTAGGELCPTEFERADGHFLFSPTIDGERVAWVDCVDCFGATGDDVYTRFVSEPDSHLVTNESTAMVESPYVDGDRIFWMDYRSSNADIYVENAVDPNDLIPLDVNPPGSPSEFNATTFGGAIELAWANPGDADFYGVRVYRRSGTFGPTQNWMEDPSASIVYEGSGTMFTDTDTLPGVQYTYAIFALDHEPNFSPPATASAG